MRRGTVSLAAIGVFATIILLVRAPDAVGQKGVLGWGAPTGDGLVVPDEAVRYVALQAGEETVVARIATNGGAVERLLTLDGRYAVPAVAHDGSASGRSADGARLILAEQGVRFPRRQSRFAIIEPRRMRHVDTVVLDGTFTFDAISPDGRLLYLIEYVSPRDVSRYQVRAYDVRLGRLVPEPIIDARVAPEVMRGWPVTRANSPDGRWAFTLYDSADRNRPPFIHALDTENGSALCIDLDQPFVNRRKVSRMTLDPTADGAALTVVDRATPVAVVDLTTFEVSAPPLDAESRPAPADPDGGGTPWGLVGIGALVGALVIGRTVVHELG